MKTPLKVIIGSTLAVSLFAGFFPVLYPFLGLSWAGLKHYFFWQPITYIFLEKGPISFNFFLVLGFNMYILWMFGLSLIERIGSTFFLSLYFSSSLIGAFASLLFPNAYLAGSANAVYAILIGWMMLNPHSQLLLFFSFPFKASYLIIALLGMNLALDLSSARFADAAALFASALYSYIFALLAWRGYGPISVLHRFERRFLKLFEKRKTDNSIPKTKIFDIQSGRPVTNNDDEFMDQMLEKISKQGEDSLTSEEKKRMKEISKKRS